MCGEGWGGVGGKRKLAIWCCNDLHSKLQMGSKQSNWSAIIDATVLNYLLRHEWEENDICGCRAVVIKLTVFSQRGQIG